MNPTIIISVIFFLLVVVTGLFFASIYLFRKSFMPYHAAAVGHSWAELDPSVRVLIIALMRVAGGGWLASSVAMGWMILVPLSNGEAWSALAILCTGLLVSVPTLVATLIVRTHTKGRPPVFAAAVAIVLLITGFLFFML